MSEGFDAREAGRSIREGFEFLRSTFNHVSQLLQSGDSLFGECKPPWNARESNVTWWNSAALGNADQWIPRFFVRVWRHAEESDARWRRAAVAHIVVYDEDEAIGEPWIGCYLLEALPEQGLSDWQPDWICNMADPQFFDVRWLPGMEDRVFEGCQPRDVEKYPIRACGYYLNLTEIRSAEDLQRMVVKPLVDLAASGDVEKLRHLLVGKPLPQRSE